MRIPSLAALALGVLLPTAALAQSAPGSVLTDAQTVGGSPVNALASFQNLTELPLQALHVQDVTVRRYLRDVRQGGTENAEKAVAVGSDRHAAMWFTGNGRFGVLKGGENRYRESYGAYAATGGVDLRLARGTLVGLYGGYDVAEARLNPLSPSSDARTWFAGGYASATVGPVYIDAHGSYGRTNFKLRRTLADGFGGGITYRGDSREPESEQYQGTATAGLSKDFHGAEVEPYIGAKYAHVRLNSFTEGTTLGALNEDRISTDSLESIAGLRLGFKVPLTGTAVLRPSIRGEYRHEFDNAGRNRTLTGFYNDGAAGGTPISFRTNAFDQDYAAVGAGFTVSGNSPISLVVDYNGQIGREKSIHGITGGFHLAF